MAERSVCNQPSRATISLTSKRDIPHIPVQPFRNAVLVRSVSSWLLILTGIVLIGCTSKRIPLDLVQLKATSPIGAIHSNGPGFKVTTYKGALSGAFMGPIVGTLHQSRNAYALGAQMMQQYNLKDPTLELKAHFIASLATQLGLASIEDVPIAYAPEHDLTIRQKFRDGVVFRFTSNHVELIYLPLHWSRYRVIYKGEAALLSYKSAAPLWEASCEVFEETSIAPTYDELIANGGALLKHMLSESAKSCAAQLLADLLESGKAVANPGDS